MRIKDNERILIEKLELEIEKTGHITNCYILKDKNTSKACVIDPAFDGKYIANEVEKLNASLARIIITHTHADHIAGLKDLVDFSDSIVYVYESDYDGLFDKDLNESEKVDTIVKEVEKHKIKKVKDNDIMKIGNTELQVIHTPGHTKGSMTLYDKADNILFAGDTIFEKTYGRTDLKTGKHEDMKKTLNKLFDTFDDILVLPGHGKNFNLKDSKRGIRLLFAYKG